VFAVGGNVSDTGSDVLPASIRANIRGVGGQGM
jgi:hypothetical protein